MRIHEIEGTREVCEIHGPMDKGVTMPILVSLDGGPEAVVKYQHNPCGIMVLINEWIGTQIADDIGLPIANYGLCALSEQAIDEYGNPEILTKANSGLAFYSEYNDRVIPVNRRVLSLCENLSPERLILFDCITNNVDRHKGNLLLDYSKKEMLVIDNSHVIVESRMPRKHDYIMARDRKITYVKDVVDSNGIDIYNPLLKGKRLDVKTLKDEAEKIRLILSGKELTEIKKSIPEEWAKDRREEIEVIFEVISREVSRLDQICDEVIKSWR